MDESRDVAVVVGGLTPGNAKLGLGEIVTDSAQRALTQFSTAKMHCWPMGK